MQVFINGHQWPVKNVTHFGVKVIAQKKCDKEKGGVKLYQICVTSFMDDLINETISWNGACRFFSEIE